MTQSIKLMAWAAAAGAALAGPAALAQTITNYDPATRYGRTEDTSPQPRPTYVQPFTHPDAEPPAVVYDRYGRPRIVVTPRGRLVRECADGYVVERRPSGDTVVPRMQCRWAYR